VGWNLIFSRIAWPKVCRLGGGVGRSPTEGAWAGPRRVRLFAAGGFAAVLIPLTACGGDPPQIVDYGPQRGSLDVSTAAPIRITFDHDVDQPSVESRLHLAPATTGLITWANAHQLAYVHPTLRTSTLYEVILEPGYRDLAGNTYSLRHHWTFTTEGPPALTAATPANGDSAVDPAAYLSLDFTRQMDPASVKSAITISPNVPFDVRLDPTDSRRAIIAPSQLLDPNTPYRMLLVDTAVDLDGNKLAANQAITFSTGPVHPLRHWITFATNGLDGSPAGLWIVNESGFPRQLYSSAGVQSFSWSPDGSGLLIQVDGASWRQLAPGGDATTLDFKGAWAGALAQGMGYVYIDATGALHRESAAGNAETIADNVAEAAVSPNGLRVAYVQRSSSNQIWAYDVGLHARYQLVTDSVPVSSLAWAPAGNRIAYLRSDPSTLTLRVRSLTGAAGTATLATGSLGAPAWLPDSTHIVFAAAVTTASGTTHKAFVINAASPPPGLTLGAGLPADPSIDVSSPASSPDGHQIAFLSGDQVWLMNADGTRPTELTRQDPGSFPYSCRAPAWTRT